MRDITGVVISNELLDAFPVKLVQIVNGEVMELFVTTDSKGKLIEELDEPTNKTLGSFFSKEELKSLSGYRGPVNLHLKDWAENMSKVIKDGFLITIDYGYERELYYSVEKSRKLLQTYYMHVDGSSPFQRIGRQDITAHVDFTALEKAGINEGFTTVYKGRQSEWLNLLGFRDLSDVIKNRQEKRLMNQLVFEDGMGYFNVLIQSKKSVNLRSEFAVACNVWQDTQITLNPTKKHMSGVRNHDMA